MLSVAEDRLRELNPDARLHAYGQDDGLSLVRWTARIDSLRSTLRVWRTG